MHDLDPDSPNRRAGRHHRRTALGVLSVAALLLHAAAFSGLDWVWPQTQAPVLPAAMHAAAAVELAPAIVERPMAGGPVSVEPVERQAPVRREAVRARPPAPRAEAGAQAEAAPVEAPVAPPVQLALNAAGPPAANSAATPKSDEDTIPHYRTKLPPAAMLRYEMQRGMLRGTGDLAWRPQGDRYELKLEAKVAGLAVLTQVSSGGFDAAGVAPLRFTDQRLRRGTTAANFQRAADKISYSGTPDEFALRAGAQDRLSWMVQLAAIVAAEPQLATPGAKVVMYVTGARGDAGVWSFRCIGPEAVAARGGTIDAIKFMREPREPYDTTVQVWLDPAQHDLPVRATQKSGPNDEGYELRLLEILALN